MEEMITHANWTSVILLAGLALAGCQQAKPDGNAVAPTVAEKVADTCAPPVLVAADGKSVESALIDDINENFEIAYKAACAKGVLKGRKLIDPKASDQNRLFLVGAPEANVASIYLSEVDGNHMVLEYPFLTMDGQTHVPTADELEEAIYCTVVGATAQEQEGSGRCLVD
jgi:hypothetical protein